MRVPSVSEGRTFKVFVDLKTRFLDSTHLGEHFGRFAKIPFFLECTTRTHQSLIYAPAVPVSKTSVGSFPLHIWKTVKNEFSYKLIDQWEESNIYKGPYRDLKKGNTNLSRRIHGDAADPSSGFLIVLSGGRGWKFGRKYFMRLSSWNWTKNDKFVDCLRDFVDRKCFDSTFCQKDEEYSLRIAFLPYFPEHSKKSGRLYWKFSQKRKHVFHFWRENAPTAF